MVIVTHKRQRLLMAYIAALGCMMLPQQTSAQKNSLPSWMVAQAKQRLATYYAWLNAPWSDDDTPYQKIRDNIDRDLTAGQDAEAVYQRYKTQAVKAPTEPKAVFGLTYAAYRAEMTPSNSDKTQIIDDVGYISLLIEYKKASLPHTYNYARLAFVSYASAFADPKMIDVGKRLFQRDSNDHDVEYYLSAVLNSSNDPADRQQAMAYEQDLARRTPNDPRLYRLLGMIHYNTAWVHHSQTELDACIEAYQRYLQLAPSDKETRSIIPARIKFAQNLKVQWSKGG